MVQSGRRARARPRVAPPDVSQALLRRVRRSRTRETMAMATVSGSTMAVRASW